MVVATPLLVVLTRTATQNLLNRRNNCRGPRKNRAEIASACIVALLPALMVATLVVLKGAFRYDPPDVPQVGTTITVATMAFMATVHGLVLAWNLGYAVPFDLVLAGSLVWAVLIVVYAANGERVHA
ncbi:SdpI family protein [Haloarcula brevis]|uniref:hypothetical protein n=1 Tax=Haloarcula brevis TaxID=3111453 RepID=UPI00300EA4CB